MDISNQRTVEQGFCLCPKLIPGFSISFCIGDQCSHQFQNIFFRVDIRHRVIVHRLFEVDSIENLDVVVVLQKGIATFDDNTALWISDHIRTVHLEQIRFQPKTSLTGTRTTNNQNIFISGIGRTFRTVTHHQSFCFCENHIVLKFWSHERLNVFGGSP